VTKQDHGLSAGLDVHLIPHCAPALVDAASGHEPEPVYVEMAVQNVHRAVGTTLSHEVTKRYGAAGLPEGTVHVKLDGHAGQSLGAWLCRGITLELGARLVFGKGGAGWVVGCESWAQCFAHHATSYTSPHSHSTTKQHAEGDANDYCGKGLSGGTIAVYPPKDAKFVPEENVIVGNVALYGAVSGRAFFRGVAAERFCVRNSGASAVVEGCGDHGCEYMTGGVAVVLGPTGKNFGAGMSGGLAFVYDPHHRLPARANADVKGDLLPLEDPKDAAVVKRLITEHLRLTGSEVARRLLLNWERERRAFVKVFPHEYRRALAEAAAVAAAEEAQKEMLAVSGALLFAVVCCCVWVGDWEWWLLLCCQLMLPLLFYPRF
jgi:glutamate synthase (NADPH/NADH)